MRPFLALASALAALVGCPDTAPAPPPTPPPVVAPTGTTGPVVADREPIDLADATLADVARALATATGRPVAVDPAAEELASCVRITVVAPGAATADEVFGVVARALEGSALSLDRSTDGIVVRRVPDAAPPASCAAEVAERSGERRPERSPAEESRSDPSCAVPLDAVRRQNATTYLVTRAARDGAFAVQSECARSVRVVPDIQGGHVVGLKLYGIRRASLIGALGFQNGDSIQTINGADISSPERALEAYTRLRDASSYEVRIDRRGQPVTLTYRVVERLP